MKQPKTKSQKHHFKYWVWITLITCVSSIGNVSIAQTISPMLVGNNAWFTNPTDEVWALTGECGVKTIRIGGNSFNDNMPSNATLLEWIKKIRAIGAEPIVQVSQHQSAAVAASVVQFLNIEKSGEIAPVKYWNIGNEPWLEANRPPTSEVGALVEAYFKPISAAMKEVDPTIKIFGPDFAYYIEDALDDLFGGVNDIAGKIPGKDYYYCDGLSWHRYPQDDNINLAYQGIEDFKTAIIKCKQKVDAINVAYNRTGDEALQWGIGEYNAKNGPVVHTWENGQMFGGVLGLCMKYGATYAATWSMFENGGSRTGTDYSFIDGANMTPRSSYRHMEFVAKHFTGNYLEGTTSNSDIIVYGAQDGGKTSVMIMNRESGAPLKYTLHLNTSTTTGDHVLLNVNGGIDKSYADIIGERTTQVLIFEGESITKINYTAYHFDNELSPVEILLGAVTEPPAVPLELNGQGVSYNQIQIGWTDNSTNESGFIIERSTGGSFEIIGLIDANVTTFTDYGLTPETTYDYRIQSYNGLGESEYSNIVSIITNSIPDQVTFNGPHTIPGKLQAEDYNDNDQGIGYNDSEPENRGGQYRINQGVDIETCTDTGGGFNIGYITDGEWMKYSIDAVAADSYSMAFRLASNTTGTKKISVSLDDVVLGSVVPNNTAGWQNWETLYIKNITLEEGANQVLKLSFEGSGFNINWFEFTADEITSVVREVATSKIKYFYNEEIESIHLELPEVSRYVNVSVYDLSGRRYFKVEKKNWQIGDFKVSDFAKGIYILNVETNNWIERKKVIIY